jgi:hypothetical protein
MYKAPGAGWWRPCDRLRDVSLALPVAPPLLMIVKGSRAADSIVDFECEVRLAGIEPPALRSGVRRRPVRDAHFVFRKCHDVLLIAPVCHLRCCTACPERTTDAGAFKLLSSVIAP